MSPRLLPLALAACAVLSLAGLVACGGDDDDDDSQAGGGAASPTAAASPASASPGGPAQSATVSPLLQGPASKYAVSQDDLPKSAYITELKSTFSHTLKMYATTRVFDSVAQGERLLQSWGYLGGYETGYEPAERAAAVLAGDLYINVEVHLFRDATGAHAAYEYFTARLKANTRNQAVEARQVGNESSTWRQVSGRIPSSTVEGVYHRVVFRRGNLVAVVSTYGAEVFMTPDPVIALAEVVDEKALDRRRAAEPTPVPGAR